jgi:hypothetical protein
VTWRGLSSLQRRESSRRFRKSRHSLRHIARAAYLIAIVTTLAASACNRRTLFSVCEVLAEPERFANSAVAVIGQMERSVSLIDHYEFLSQDQCEHPLVTHGHRWVDKIQVWTNSTEGMPEPPADRPRLEPAPVAAKLSIVRKTTNLRSHDEPTFRADGKSTVYNGTKSVKNEWAVVYGRVMKNASLDENCGVGGCGGDNVPLTIVVKPYNVFVVGEDGAVPPKRAD